MKQIINTNTGVTMGENLHGYRHHDAMWFDEDKHASYKAYAETIINFCNTNNRNINTILELGSGAGSLAYFMRFSDSTKIIATLDGNIESSTSSPFLKKDNHFCVRTDTEYKIIDDNDEQIKFDLIVSFEHFEHISNEEFGMFIQNIKNHSHKDTTMITTAANWGEGDIHINVKSKDQWIDYLEKECGMKNIEDEIGNIFKNVSKPFNFDLDRTSFLFFKIFA